MKKGRTGTMATGGKPHGGHSVKVGGNTVSLGRAKPKYPRLGGRK